MAVVFSLPWALLMWSMWFFFVALILSCIAIGNTFIRVPVAVAMVITHFFILSNVVIVFQFSNSFWDDIAVLKAIYDRILASVKRFTHICRPRSTARIPHSGRYRRHTLDD
ncbi:hypothetical protein BJV78DRAFT_1196654 [Lactifluus subvellereus]|nr:hypothetical protein BJV78DRAFT_1196654 [Lactifluus subvellereus]